MQTQLTPTMTANERKTIFALVLTERSEEFGDAIVLVISIGPPNSWRIF